MLNFGYRPKPQRNLFFNNRRNTLCLTLLPELGYAYNALEPHFDAQTMEIHHSKHHQAYVNNANAALEGLPAELVEMYPGHLISNLDKIPAEKRGALRNNAGGHTNHSLFWKSLKKRHYFTRRIKRCD